MSGEEEEECMSLEEVLVDSARYNEVEDVQVGLCM
jgi:hypothetical protein